MLRARNIFLQLSFFFNVLLVFFWIFEDHLKQLPPWLQVAGRLHPMILHFPISILILIAFLELIKPKDGSWNDKADMLLAITAFTASLTALFGLILFHTGGYENGSDLYWHKITGIITALLTGILSWLKNLKKIIYYPSLVLSVLIIVIAGHLGSNITHGNDFVTAPLQAPPGKLKDLAKAMVYTDIIQPIFEEKCIGCHNPNKSKGDLLLTDQRHILQGGEDGIIIVPGSPDSSRLYQFLLLPLDDDKHMPPEGKPQPDKEEIALLKWWIKEGAIFDKALAEVHQPDSIKNIIKAKYGPASPLDELEIEFADTKTIQSLDNIKRGVKQLSVDKPYLSIFLANRKDLSEKELEELEPVKDQIISIDLSHSSVKDKDLETLRKFPHLQKLHLENTSVTDTGISLLKDLSFLEYLNVSNTRVNANLLPVLRKFKNLRKVYFYETDIPASSIIAYQTSVPGLQVGFTPDLSSDTLFRGKLTDPVVEIDSNMFLNFATVEMSYRLKGVNIHYTTNGKEPDSSSPAYSKPLIIDSNTVLKLAAMRSGWQSSPVQTYVFRKAIMKFSDARLDSLPDKRYQARLDTSLIDLQKGSLSQSDGKYLGFEGKDMLATLDLGEARSVSSLSLGYLANHRAFILSPIKFEAWGSTEKNGPMKKLGVITQTENTLVEGAKTGSLGIDFKKQPLRYIRVKVTNIKKTPKWHPSKGSNSWIFIDEIMAK
jgi:uncharacterized membrane protein